MFGDIRADLVGTSAPSRNVAMTGWEWSVPAPINSAPSLRGACVVGRALGAVAVSPWWMGSVPMMGRLRRSFGVPKRSLPPLRERRDDGLEMTGSGPITSAPSLRGECAVVGALGAVAVSPERTGTQLPHRV